MNVSLKEVRYFLKVVEIGNISRAAEHLGIQQPSLSVAVRKLERELGVPLLMRAKSGVAPTKSGTIFAQQSRALIESWEILHKAVLCLEKEMAGRYALGCHPIIATHLVPLFYPTLLERYPQIEILLQHDVSRAVVDWVIAGQLDFAIAANPVPHPDLVIVPLGSDLVTLFGARRFHGADPAQTLLICCPDLTQTHIVLEALSRKRVTFKRTITTSYDAMVALTEAEVGVGILTEIQTLGRSSSALAPLKGYPRLTNEIALVFRQDMQKTLAARAIIDTIKEKGRWPLSTLEGRRREAEGGA